MMMMFCAGQVIGAIVAVNQDVAQSAARLVRVEYEDLPAVITITWPEHHHHNVIIIIMTS